MKSAFRPGTPWLVLAALVPSTYIKLFSRPFQPRPPKCGPKKSQPLVPFLYVVDERMLSSASIIINSNINSSLDMNHEASA
jgi:hypothetical protein